MSAALVRPITPKITETEADQLYQHHPHAFDRCSPAGQVRPPGHADGARAAGLYAVEPGHALRSPGSDLAKP